jgi:hypothetical protein
MSRASGRTPDAELIVSQKPGSLEIAIPSVCVMEAHKAFAAMRAAKGSFRKDFNSHITDIQRDPGANAQEFTRSLATADLALVNYLDECQQRLDRALDDLLAVARIIAPSRDALLRKVTYVSEPTDDIIVGSILEDARMTPDPNIRFLSEDNDFAMPSLQDLLHTENILRTTSVAECLEWFRAIQPD